MKRIQLDRPLFHACSMINKINCFNMSSFTHYPISRQSSYVHMNNCKMQDAKCKTPIAPLQFYLTSNLEAIFDVKWRGYMPKKEIICELWEGGEFFVYEKALCPFFQSIQIRSVLSKISKKEICMGLENKKIIVDPLQFSGKYPADIQNFIACIAISFYLTSEETHRSKHFKATFNSSNPVAVFW